MNKIFLWSILMILSLSTFVAAGEIFFAPILDEVEELPMEEKIQEEKETIMEQLPELQEAYNQNPLEIPGIVQSLVGDETITIFFDGGYTIGVQVKDGKEIVLIQEGQLENPGLEISVHDKVFEDYNYGKLDIKQSIDNNEVEFYGVGFMNKIKYSIAATLVKTFL